MRNKDSDLLHSWLNRERRFHLATLNLLPNSYWGISKLSGARLAKVLSENHVFVRHLRIDGTLDPKWTFSVLGLSLFENLEELEIFDLGLNVELLSDNAQQYQVDMANLFTKATWKRTLTRLCIPSPMDDFSVDGVSTSALQLLPELIDF